MDGIYSIACAPRLLVFFPCCFFRACFRHSLPEFWAAVKPVCRRVFGELFGCTVTGVWCLLLLLATSTPEPDDLKSKYDASWALVTGNSSGIGKESARKLLSRSLKVVIVRTVEHVPPRICEYPSQRIPRFSWSSTGWNPQSGSSRGSRRRNWTLFKRSGRCVLVENQEEASKRVVPLTLVRPERKGGDGLGVLAKRNSDASVFL